MTCPKVKLFSRSKFQMGLCVTNRDNYLEKTEAESEHLSLHSIILDSKLLAHIVLCICSTGLGRAT